MNHELLRELHTIRLARRFARRKKFLHSRLDRYRSEILQLRHARASYYEVSVWLRTFKRVEAHPTTVWRALRRWEFRED